MISKGEFIRALTGVESVALSYYNIMPNIRGIEALHKDMATTHAYVDQLEAEIPKWRSVEKDGLPEDNQQVLAHRVRTIAGNIKYPVVTAWFSATNGFYVTKAENNGPIPNVTHYLPLSDLPEPIEEA